MRTAEETFFVWNEVDKKVLERIQDSIDDFKKVGLEVEEIKIIFKEERDRGANNCLGEQKEEWEGKVKNKTQEKNPDSATDKQISYLKRLGYDKDASKLTKIEAKELIADYLKKGEY